MNIFTTFICVHVDVIKGNRLVLRNLSENMCTIFVPETLSKSYIPPSLTYVATVRSVSDLIVNFAASYKFYTPFLDYYLRP